MDNAVPKKIECFEDLIIWQRAVAFATDIYALTEATRIKSDFGLKDQLRRAVDIGKYRRRLRAKVAK